jgi:hypothetical protein
LALNIIIGLCYTILKLDSLEYYISKHEILARKHKALLISHGPQVSQYYVVRDNIIYFQHKPKY